MNNWKKLEKQGHKTWDKTKQFFKTLLNKTVEESKVVTARASEAGRLTALNTQRYRIQREINDHFHELGARFYDLIKRKVIDLSDDPSITAEVNELKSCESQLSVIDNQIGSLRKSTDVAVKKIHETHQGDESESQPHRKVANRK